LPKLCGFSSDDPIGEVAGVVLGKVDELPGYHDVRSYPGARWLPGLVLYRFDAPLFFANAKTFRDQIRRLGVAEPGPAVDGPRGRAGDRCGQYGGGHPARARRELHEQGTELVFAELKDPGRRKMARYGLGSRRGYATVEAAVAAFREEAGGDWVAPGVAEQGSSTGA
jgi:hypothetical protein